MIKLDWKKVNGLIPAIIQDHQSLQVLMLGYMNEEALKISQSSGLATFLVEQGNVFGQKEKPQGTN